MNGNNLLVISNNFPNQDDTYVGNMFVKEQVKLLSKSFKNVYVISPIPFGIEMLRKTRYSDYRFDNVRVFFPRYLNSPINWTHARTRWVTNETKAIRSLLVKEDLRYDLIHAHSTWPSGAVAVQLKRDSSVPVIITEHTSNTFQRAIEDRDEIFIESWRTADKIIRVRQSDASMFQRVSIPAEKIVSIPNGFDEKKFHPMDMAGCRKALNLSQDKRILLYVGNLYSEVKGHKHLIDAMVHVSKERQDVICIIVGGGKLRSKIQKQIRSLGLESSVVIVETQPHDMIPQWLNACDLFVLPSLNEGFPTVLPEALGCGKPVVGTKVGGVPEIISSPRYGLLVEPGDPHDLSQKILTALDQRWDEGAILRYARRFTWYGITEEIAAVYRELLA